MFYFTHSKRGPIDEDLNLSFSYDDALACAFSLNLTFMIVPSTGLAVT